MVLLMGTTIVYVPIVLPWLLPGVSVNALPIARSLVILMLIPLAIALFIRSRYLEVAESLQGVISTASNTRRDRSICANVGVEFSNAYCHDRDWRNHLYNRICRGCLTETMPNWIAKKHLRFRFRQFPSVILIASLTIVVARIGLTQEVSPTPATPQTTTASPQRINSKEIPSDGVYFADILVRGQPVFQVGSLSNLSASDRAQIVNRRIKSVLAQPNFEGAVTVEPDPQRGIAIIKFNNRVLMTVTQQDAQDFNTTVESLARQWADELNSAFEQPPFVIDVGQRLWSTLRSLQRDTISNLPSFIGALLALLATWLIARSLRRLTLVGTRQWQGDGNSKILVSRVV